MDQPEAGEVWCRYPGYSWHGHFLPAQPPSSQPVTPSESLHEHETREWKAERIHAVLQVKSHVFTKMHLHGLDGRTMPNVNTRQAREKT